MSEQATIIDFLSASLKSIEASGRAVLSPAEQAEADAIAAALDQELDQMVHELERVASCQQEDDAGALTDPLPPFEAFCVGLSTIGGSLLPHLVDAFKKLCRERALPEPPFAWIIRARADAFVAYLLQVAQVHGLAFENAPSQMGKSEQIALANLGAALRTRMITELDKLQ